MSHQFDDAREQRIFSRTYQAFRNRRSLLLLHLQKLVQFEELPWVSALLRTVRSDGNASAIAHQTFVEVAVLNLAAFPQAIVLNKLLQELRALAKTAEMPLAFVNSASRCAAREWSLENGK